ncbi:MAG: NUDIX hydrolase [Actinomycetaceae bacterium]|nr:NUDIX hydrolase [Arcanobacterium sp.]MDD7504408.1 NUDIX hydrolase [Actinomycetaceae bacterium]
MDPHMDIHHASKLQQQSDADAGAPNSEATPLRDVFAPDHVETIASDEQFRGPIFTIRDDEIQFASGERARRQYMIHDDAAAIVPIRPGERGYEVLLIRQYRHAPRRVFWEIPAGLCDDPEETALQAAQRELAEETSMQAERWFPLVSFFSSPGVSDENLDVFLALDVTHIDSPIDFQREAEEGEIEARWFGLTEVYDAVSRGELRSPTLVLGIMAAYIHSSTDFTDLPLCGA